MPARALDQPAPTALCPTDYPSQGRRSFSRGLLLAAMLVTISLACFAADWWTRRHADLEARRDNRVIVISERVLSALKDVETGQRGYLLTGDDAYLAPYTAALPQLHDQLELLANSGFSLDGLSDLVKARVTAAEAGIARRRTGGLSAALSVVNGVRGKDLMDAVRDKIAAIQNAAQTRIDKRGRQATRLTAILTAISLLTLGGAVVIVGQSAGRRRRENRLLQQRIYESEGRFRTLAENSAAIIWTTSPQGKFVTEQVQWSTFTGQVFGHMDYAGWANAIHPDDRDRTLRDWLTAVSTRQPFVIEHRLRRADGEWRHMAVHAVPVLDKAGNVREWVGTHTDITERRLAEEALAAAKDAAEAANRSKSAFLANMSHELRTPLSAVIGYSEMLEEEMEELDQPHLVTDLKKIETNARHLLSLINDVLDLSKIEANKMTSYAEDFDVATLAKDAAGTVDSLVRKKGNTLRLDLADDLGSMHSDVVKLRQCLFNLISNAAKFTEKGEISLSVRRDGAWMEFRVTDNGIGMNEEQLGRLFQRFEQADGSTTRNFGGTGLGLALTRAFCRLLGGEVSVESSPGKGTIFTLRIPANMPDQVAEAEPEAAEHALPGRQLILVVDDDPAQRELLTRFLEREGFAVRTAPDGRSGLEMIRALKPRAVLLDVIMPQMDGWSVLTALKADPSVAHIPVIMASFVKEPQLASALGATDYIVKPIEWDQLKAITQRFRSAEGSVLIVDDDPDARGRLRIALEREGWVVGEAGNGEEALASVAKMTPQLILLDLTMPVMDGFTFLDALRARPGGADISVVVLSARDLSKTDRVRLDSADRVLRKGDVDLRDLPRQLADLKHKSE